MTSKLIDISRDPNKRLPKDIFTSIDLELNQNPTSGPKIIQIGAVVGNIRTGEILERYSAYINPQQALEPFIIQLTKITQEQVDSADTLLSAYMGLEEMHKRHNSFINPITWGGGDTTELYAQLKTENTNFSGWCFGRRWIDAKTLYCSYRIARGEDPSGGLAKAMTKFKLRFNGQKHNALADAENTFQIYKHMLGMFQGGKT